MSSVDSTRSADETPPTEPEEPLDASMVPDDVSETAQAETCITDAFRFLSLEPRSPSAHGDHSGDESETDEPRCLPELGEEEARAQSPKLEETKIQETPSAELESSVSEAQADISIHDIKTEPSESELQNESSSPEAWTESSSQEVKTDLSISDVGVDVSTSEAQTEELQVSKLPTSLEEYPASSADVEELQAQVEEPVPLPEGASGVLSSEAQVKEAAVAITPTQIQEDCKPKGETTKDPTSGVPPSLHHLKTIPYLDRKVAIVTQNENGPCPLVAIINTLLLRRKLSLSTSGDVVSSAKLMEHLGDAILENVPQDLADREVRLNFEQNMSDAMAVLPKLQTGLDVNVQFTGVQHFEYTPELIVFDLLGIRLYHGWLVDPQDAEIVAAIGQAGYNQLVERVITNRSSGDADKATEALIIESFLERSASQLTYHGLVELTAAMNDGEVAVLFRNNHFSTILKHQHELLQLVTDQGFLGEPSVVWETLANIDGDGQFVDGAFRTVPPRAEPSPTLRRPATTASAASASAAHREDLCSGTASSTATVATPTAVDDGGAVLSTEQQIDQDFLVALSLQEDQSPEASAQPVHPQSAMSVDERVAQELRDAELARQLQEEEQRRAAPAAAADDAASGGRSPASQSTAQTRKKENCIFL